MTIETLFRKYKITKFSNLYFQYSPLILKNLTLDFSGDYSYVALSYEIVIDIFKSFSFVLLPLDTLLF